MTRERTVVALASIAADHASGRHGATAIPRLTIWCSAGPTDPTPAMFGPKFYILLQGAKRLTIGGNDRDFTAGRCAVASVGLPFTSQVIEASAEMPYLGVEIGLDGGVIANLLLDLPDAAAEPAPAFATSRASESVTEPLYRLMRLLASPAEIPVLASQFERELYFRLLQGPLGGTLRQIVQKNTRFDQVRTAVEWLCANAYKPMRVERLAASVGMSVTSFHRHFKAVTAHSPLAYQRHIRLLDARGMLASGTTNVTTAAFATGYASSSQFSREYKRLFGNPPARDAAVLPH